MVLYHNILYQTSILLKKSLRLTRNCRTGTRSYYQQACYKEVAHNQKRFKILVSGTLSTNSYIISTCFAETMASDSSFSSSM